MFRSKYLNIVFFPILEIPTPECVNVNMDLVSASVTWSKPEGVTQASYSVTLHSDGECLQTISTRSLQHRFSKLEIGREYAVTVCTRLKKRSSKFISKTIRTGDSVIRPKSFFFFLAQQVRFLKQLSHILSMV